MNIAQVESRYTLTGVFVNNAGRYRCSASSSVFPEEVETECAQLQIVRKLQKYTISYTKHQHTAIL